MITDRPIVVVGGPTATGKTASALALARALGGELIGADSVQIYRGFDVGSAKPSREELGDVVHHLIDTCDPDEAVDAKRFADLADAAIADVHARGHVPIVVGGTGLWLRALLRGLMELPPVDHGLRARLDAETDELGAAAMHARLTAVDPLAAKAIHANDRIRIVRALEIFEQTGKPAGEHRREHALGGPRYRALSVVVDLPWEELTPRIELRTRAMLAAGVVGETRALLERYPRTARAFGSVGYKQIVDHLDTPSADLEGEIVRATRVYARRQRTWFRSEPGYDWHTRADVLAGEEGLGRWRRFLSE